MTPWRRAYESVTKYSAGDFAEMVSWHMDNGFVFSSPEVFMLAHMVAWDGEKEVAGEPNAYFIELAASAGRVNLLAEMRRIAPHAVEWVLWRRRGEARVRSFRWEKLDKKVRV
jgi:hypothetical protein